MEKTTIRILSVLLTIVLLTGLMPFTAFAAEGEGAAELNAAAQQAETYTITYYQNDGQDNSNTSRSHAQGEIVALNEVSFSRSPTFSHDGLTGTRYILAGWNTSRTGNGTGYLLTDTIPMPDHNLVLYAVWETAEQYYWALTVQGHGTVTYKPLVASPGDNWCSAREGDLVKIFVEGRRLIRVGTIYGFTPEADPGYIFNGWYFYEVDDADANKLDVTVLGRDELKDLKLTDDILIAGRNQIIASFVENKGTHVSVRFEGGNGDVYYQQMLKKGDPMPRVDDPVWNNHYFLGWDQSVPAFVPDTDVTFTAQWLEGPTIENTPNALYRIACATEDHPIDAWQGMNWGTPNKIQFDAERGVYVCTVTLDRIGTYLGVGSACYDALTGREHFTEEVWPEHPVIRLVWNNSQWVGDGEQIVSVYHETGEESIPQDVLDSLSPIICVTETGNPSRYKKLGLIDNTYEIAYAFGDGSAAAAITITDFKAYAKQLGAFYVPDWDNNVHKADYYVFYLTRSEVSRTVGGDKRYLAWSAWSLDTSDNNTEYTNDGVYYDEASYGKELLATVPIVEEVIRIAFTDGRDGEAFEDIVFETSEGEEQPWRKYDSVEEFEYELLPELYEMQLEDGSFFQFWDPDLYEYAEGNPYVTEDVTFEAVWARYTDVVYRDGADGEVFDELRLEYAAGLDEEFPAFCTEDGENEPVREGYTFAGWESVEDEEAEGTFVDELSGYTVNWQWEDGYRFFYILLDAQWTQDEEPGLEVSFKRSCSFGNNLSINYYIPEAALEGYENCRLHIEKQSFNADGSDCSWESFELSSYTDSAVNGEACKRFVFSGISAKEMSDEIHVTVLADRDGETFSSNADVYSVRKYAMNRLAASEDGNFKRLLVDMLNYGAWAQRYFGYNTSHPANDGLTAEQRALGTAELPALSSVSEVVTTPGATAHFVGRSIVFNSNVEMKFYMHFDTGAPADSVRLVVRYTAIDNRQHTETIPASRFGYDSARDAYTGKITTIAAKDMGCTVTAEIYDGDTKIGDVQIYSIESYVVNRLADSGDEVFKALVSELIKYGRSAENYFRNRS